MDFFNSNLHDHNSFCTVIIKIIYFSYFGTENIFEKKSLDGHYISYINNKVTYVNEINKIFVNVIKIYI